MPQYYPSLIPFRGRPARLPRKLSEADRVTLLQFMHRIADLRREMDRLSRERSGLISRILIANAEAAQLVLVQEGYRDVKHRVENIERREVLGHDAETKKLQSDLVMSHDDLLRDHARRIVRLERTVGEEPDA